LVILVAIERIIGTYCRDVGEEEVTMVRKRMVTGDGHRVGKGREFPAFKNEI